MRAQWCWMPPCRSERFHYRVMIPVAADPSGLHRRGGRLRGGASMEAGSSPLDCRLLARSRRFFFFSITGSERWLDIAREATLQGKIGRIADPDRAFARAAVAVRAGDGDFQGIDDRLRLAMCAQGAFAAETDVFDRIGAEPMMLPTSEEIARQACRDSGRRSGEPSLRAFLHRLGLGAGRRCSQVPHWA